MQIQFAAFPENAAPTLKTFATEKAERLGKFYDRIIDIDVFVRSGNDPSGTATAEFRVNVPSNTLFCEEHADTFEEALDKASRAMERQLKRFKEKQAAY